MGSIIAVSFLAGNVFACVIMWLAKERVCDDDPMDEAEANIPRCCPGDCDCGSDVDTNLLLPRRERKPSGRKYFIEN